MFKMEITVPLDTAEDMKTFKWLMVELRDGHVKRSKRAIKARRQGYIQAALHFEDSLNLVERYLEKLRDQVVVRQTRRDLPPGFRDELEVCRLTLEAALEDRDELIRQGDDEVDSW